MRFQPLGLDHVVLRVRDQEVSQRFYTDVLGCTLDHMNERISLMQLRFGAQLIDLLPAGAEAQTAGGGLDHVCLSIRCADLGALREELLAQAWPSRVRSWSGAGRMARGRRCTCGIPTAT